MLRNSDKKKVIIVAVIVIFAILIGVVAAVKLIPTNKKDNTKIAEQTAKKTTAQKEESKKTDAKETKTGKDRFDPSLKIEGQSFDGDLKGLGNVSFESYAPDAQNNKYEDATFRIVKDNQSFVLPEMEANNMRTNKVFLSVEAVSFNDYNNDQKDDIYIINRYNVDNEKKDEARIYQQGNDGKFTLDEKLTSDINNNVSDKTISNIKDYIQSIYGKNNADTENWKQAYTNWLSQQDMSSDYYIFDLNNDNIPEIVISSAISAYGSKLAAYNRGSIQEIQVAGNTVLYTEGEETIDIAGGSMDEYFDQIYAIQNGQWSLLAQGEYGAEDNTNVQFDENNQPIYQYNWDGAEVDRDTYNKSVDFYVTRGNAVALTYNDALARINNY